MTLTHYFKQTPTTTSQINWCSYSRWSPFFQDFTPDAKIFKLIPTAFLDYLNSESIRLPPAKYEDPVAANSDNEYSDWEDELLQENPCAPFQEFHEKVQLVVEKWGSVLVKLNWSAPKDAKWILINNSLRCTSAGDIYLLLNASDHIAHDLENHIYDEAEKDGDFMEPELVLKKWIPDMNPALEFRIFVKDRKILGVSQRDMNHYVFLHELQGVLHECVQKFYDAVISKTAFPLADYVMDVFIPRPYSKVTVVDINPFTRKWDGLLFTWNEMLEKENDGDFELRILTESNMGNIRKDNSESQVPLEVVDASLNSEAMVELAKNWHLLGAPESS